MRGRRSCARSAVRHALPPRGSSCASGEQKNRALRGGGGRAAGAAARGILDGERARPAGRGGAGRGRRHARSAAASTSSASRRMARGTGGASRSCRIRSAPCSPNGRGPTACVIQRRRVPLGVIGIIYESRPNVTADAGALCLKSGNAVILRGGSESLHSSAAIHACLVAGIATRRPAGRLHSIGAHHRPGGRRLHAGGDDRQTSM